MSTAATIYLIHNSEIEFSPEFQLLKSFKKDKKIPLQPQESKVLEALCRNANRYNSKEKLLNSCWSTEVEDNSLTRVISLLRKYFKILGAQTGLIVNKTKLGYMLESDVQITEEARKQFSQIPFLEDTNQKEQAKSVEQLHNQSNANVSLENKSKWLAVVGRVAAISVLISVSITTFYLFSSPLKTPLSDNKQLNEVLLPQFDDITPLFGVEVDTQYQQPSISPDGNKMIYSKSNIMEESWQLEWKDLDSLQINHYEKSGKNMASPVWRDETTFAYHLYDTNECEIRLVTLIKDKVSEDELLSRCNPETHAKSMAWKDDDHLLFTDGSAVKKSHQLIELNVNSLMSRYLNFPSTYGRGVYGVYANDKRDKIALLINNDWKTTDIEIYKMEDFENRINTLSVKRTLFSIGWIDDTRLAFQNPYGSLSVYDVFTHKESSLPVLYRTYSNPVSGGGKLAVISGDFYVSSLHQLSSDEEAKITKRQFNDVDKASQKVIVKDSNAIYFVSNRSGKEQLYKYGDTSKRLASNFKEDLMINHISLFREKDLALISHATSVDLYKYKNGEISDKIHAWENAETGCFFNEELYLVLVNDTGPDLYRMNLDNMQIKERITSNGADNCVIAEGKLYYSRYMADGIWSYERELEDKQIVDIALLNSHNSWILSGDYLWYITPVEGILKKAHIHNIQDTVNVLNNVASIHKGGDAYYYTRYQLSPNELRLMGVQKTKPLNVSQLAH